jgi:hypothetical protein
MQLEDTASVELIFQAIHYDLQGNIMPIASHLLSKNSIVIFRALTDFTFDIYQYKIRHV